MPEPLSLHESIATAAILGASQTFVVDAGWCRNCQYLELEISSYRAAMARVQQFFAAKPGLMNEFDAFGREHTEEDPT